MIFSASCGSLENLNERTWCGLSLCSRQIRCTVVGETPVAAASRRTLQCVLPSGGLSSVLARTRPTSSSSICRGLPERGASASPSRRRSQKFRRHNPTVGKDTCVSAAICVLVTPSAARKTIRARVACCWGTEGRRSHDCSSRSSSSERSITSAARPTTPTYQNYLMIARHFRNTALGGPHYPDEVPLGVVEEPDLDLIADLLGSHHARAAEALGLGERCLHVVDADVEGDVAVVALRRGADAAADADSVRAHVGGAIDDPIVHRVVGVDLPPEQLRVVAAEPGHVPAHDLEVDHWPSHAPSSVRRSSGGRWCARAGGRSAGGPAAGCCQPQSSP